MKNNKTGWHLEQSYQRLPALFHTKVKPTKVKDPELVIANQKLAEELGLEKILRSEQASAIFAGNVLPPQSVPLAQAYAGHQFGHFTRLGDGRAILLGEHMNDGQRYDIQLKGAGETPYSRGGDGRAALGPMLREYLISEAMHALKVPTTRSLAVVTTGDPVIREDILKGAILTRIASSHLRVGTFQYGVTWGTREELRALADYAIARHDHDLMNEHHKYLLFLERVIDRQAKLIATWQLVGFVHGVMNTDNMTISGETIDYGPCAFIDTYNPKTVFSSIDVTGRYAYGQQPYIGGWNLSRLAETLIPLLHDDEKQAIDIAQRAITSYDKIFQHYFDNGMRAKLGILNEETADPALIQQLLSLMEKYQADYTNTFITLTFDTILDTPLGQNEDVKTWYKKWKERQKRQEASATQIKQVMQNHNPAVIPRNYYVEKALEAVVTENDYTELVELLNILSSPYAHTPDKKPYMTVPDPTMPYQTFCGT